MRTHYCKFATCGEVAHAREEFCQRHQTPESRHELGAFREAEPDPAPSVGLRDPDPLDYECKFASCERRVAGRVGRYSYCPIHRSRSVREGLIAIEASRAAGSPGTVAPVDATTTRPRVESAPDDTHEGRLRDVLKTARALDRAEAKSRAAAEDLRRARKSHKDALIAATAPSGVTHAE